MKAPHVIRSFQAWFEATASASERRMVDEHLQTCRRCRRYYEKMALLLERPDLSLLPRLEPDPVLPQQILAAAHAVSETKPQHPSPRLLGRMRLSVAGSLLILAVIAGMLLGRSLAGSVAYGDTDIAGAYYEAFSQSGFVEGWENLLHADTGEEVQ